jgi:hypothetical protein
MPFGACFLKMKTFGADRADCMSGGEDRVEGASMADRRYVASMFVRPLH